jgi:hypothetical protein
MANRREWTANEEAQEDTPQGFKQLSSDHILDQFKTTIADKDQ